MSGRAQAVLPLNSLYLECKAQISSIVPFCLQYELQIKIFHPCRWHVIFRCLMCYQGNNKMAGIHFYQCCCRSHYYSNQQVMKKNRKVGAKTASNFFTSEFKLKAPEPKEPHHRKFNTTLNSFKQQLIQQQAKHKDRVSKDKKPIIEQLQFLNRKEDNFKVPISITKRSVSKAKDESRVNLQKNGLYQHYQEISVMKGQTDKQKHIINMTEALKSKRFNPKDALKQKLEKAALQKFNQTVLKQNEQNQNVVSQKNAQSLYLLLKTARVNQKKNKNHLNSEPSDNTQEYHQLKTEPRQIERSRQVAQKSRKASQKISQQQNNPSENKVSRNSKDNLFRNLQQHPKVNPYQFIPKSSLPKQDKVVQGPKKDQIEAEQESQKESIKERFIQSQDQSQPDLLELKEVSSRIPQKPIESIEKKDTLKSNHTISRKDSSSSNQTNPQPNPKNMLPLDSKNSLEQKQRSVNKKESKNQFSLQMIPSAHAVDKLASKKLAKDEKNVEKQAQFLSIDNTVQKVLTPKTLVSKKQQVPKQPQKSNEPLPKLPPSLHSRLNSLPSQNDQIQEIDLKGKPSQKKIQPLYKPPLLDKKTVKKEDDSKLQQNKNPPINQARKEKANDKPPQNNVPDKTSQQKREEQQQQQENEGDLCDELAYYIQRIEDIGHYRMSSKNIYKDLSVNAQLIKFHKICAYYMSHQFLFLSKKTCDFFKSPKFDRDFYQIPPEDLQIMKEDGTLDEEIANLESYIEQSKTLLRKCYDQCKLFLPPEDQILRLEGTTNFHIKCCAYLIKEFKQVYDLMKKNKGNSTMLKRCVYLVEVFCSLKLLNGQFIKEYQEYQQLEDPVKYVEQNKTFLLS